MMKGKNLFLTALIAIIAGVALILTHNTVRSTGVVLVGGALFIISGLINVLALMGGRSDESRRRSAVSTAFGWISGAAAIVLGLCMLLFRERFVELIAFMFAIIVALGALFQFFLLAFGTQPIRLPSWLYVFPFALIGGAVYIYLLTPESEDHYIMLVTGISLVVFGAAGFVEASMIGAANRTVRKLAKANPPEAKPEKAPETSGEPSKSGTEGGHEAEKESHETPKSIDEADKQ